MDTVPLPADPLGGPEQPAVEEIAAYMVAAAVWAPSVHNTQPWWFSASGQELSLHADAGRQLMADPRGREMMISCGAALFTARLALRSLGYVPQTSVLPNPGEPLLVARVSWQQRAAAAEYEQRLYGQVRRRRTHRGGFDPVPIPADLVAMLQEGAERDGAMLRIVRSAGNRAVLAAAVETAEQALELDGIYARELASWVNPPGSARRDGVPHTAYPARSEFTLPYFPGRDFAKGHRWGVAESSPSAAPRSAGLVCILTTAGDRPVDWVNAGQALQRALLTSATCGVAAALHSQPLERARLREFIRLQLCDGAYPQLVLRLGTATQNAVSVRRAPGSVLFASGGEHLTISHE
jgi:Nitroreductase family